MSDKCKRCGKEVCDSDPYVEKVTVGQGMTSAFTSEYYHRECLSRDHIDSLQEELAQAREELECLKETNELNRIKRDVLRDELKQAKVLHLVEYQECVDALSKLDDTEEKLKVAMMEIASSKVAAGMAKLEVAEAKDNVLAMKKLAHMVNNDNAKLEKELKAQKEKANSTLESILNIISISANQSKAIDDIVWLCKKELREIQGQT